jgi:heme/copper-type cytochrome/quinol oxidase subunit 1
MVQLVGPNGSVLSADLYNQMFTMHATTMILLFEIPMAAALGNYLGVWAHHMFASGTGPVIVAGFSVSSMAMAVPTGVKIVN